MTDRWMSFSFYLLANFFIFFLRVIGSTNFQFFSCKQWANFAIFTFYWLTNFVASFFCEWLARIVEFFCEWLTNSLLFFSLSIVELRNFPCNDMQILEQFLATDWRKSCIFLRYWLTNFASVYKRPIDELHDIFFLLIGNLFLFLRTIGKNQFLSATSRLILRFTHERLTNSSILSLCQKTVPILQFIGKISFFFLDQSTNLRRSNDEFWIFFYLWLN